MSNQGAWSIALAIVFAGVCIGAGLADIDFDVIPKCAEGSTCTFIMENKE